MFSLVAFIKQGFRSLKTKGSFVRDFGVTLSGTGFVFVLQLLTSPIISRLYTPLEYGQFAIFNLLATNLSLVSLMSLPDAMISTKGIKDLINLSKVIIVSSVLFAFFILVLILTIGDTIFINIFNLTSTPIWSYLIPITIVIKAFINIGSQSLVKFRLFSSNIKSNIPTAVSRRAFAIVFGFFSITNFGLILGEFTSFFVGAILKLNQVFYKKKLVRMRFFFKYKISDVINTFMKFKNFPKYVFPGSYLNQFSIQLPAIFFSTYFLTSELGAFTFAMGITAIPLQVITKALHPVFYSRMTDFSNMPKQMFSFTVKVILSLLILGLIPFGSIYFFGDVLFEFFFGAEWTLAGIVASYLSIYLFFNYLTYGIKSIYYIINLEKLLMIVQISRFVTSLVVFAICYLIKFDFLTTIGVFSCAMAVTFIGEIILILHKLNLNKNANR